VLPDQSHGVTEKTEKRRREEKSAKRMGESVRKNILKRSYI
jgi:hypothetical protein